MKKSIWAEWEHREISIVIGILSILPPPHTHLFIFFSKIQKSSVRIRTLVCKKETGIKNFFWKFVHEVQFVKEQEYEILP